MIVQSSSSGVQDAEEAWEIGPDIAVLGALAAVHVDHHALRIDVGDFEIEAFLQPQAAGVHGEKKDVVVESFDVGQKARTSSTLRTAGRRCSSARAGY